MRLVTGLLLALLSIAAAPTVRVTTFRIALPGQQPGASAFVLPMSKVGRIDFSVDLTVTPPPGGPRRLRLEADCLGPAGEKLATTAVEVRVPADGHARQAAGRWELPVGAWPPGQVQVVFRFGQRVVGRTGFRIVDDRDVFEMLRTPIVEPDVRLFTRPAAAPPDRRDYARQFPMSTTGRIGWELRFRNNLYRLVDTDDTLVVRWLDPTGRTLTVDRHTFSCKASWFQMRLWGRFGYDEAGRWMPGRYRVRFFHGSRLLTEAAFRVTDDRQAAPLEQQPVHLDQVRFFPSPAPATQRDYRDRFPMSATTFIGWEVHVRHRRFGRGGTRGVLEVLWYGPHQKPPPATRPGDPAPTPRWTQRVDLELKRTDDLVWRTGDWGFAQPGRWLPGIYRVAFRFRGRVLAGAVLTVVDDRDHDALARRGLTLDRFVFLPPGRDAKPVATATPEGVRHLRWQLVCRNPLFGVRGGRHTMLLRWYTEQGLLLDEQQAVLEARRDQWRAAAAGPVAGVLGTPPIEGTYRVQIWYRDQMLGRAELRVVNRHP